MKKKNMINITNENLLITNKERINITRSNQIIKKPIKSKNNRHSKIFIILIIIIIIQLIINLHLLHQKRKTNKYINVNNNTNNNNTNTKYPINIPENHEKIEDIDLNILLPIKKRLGKYIEIIDDEQKFLNGLVRKYKPKKLLELGVAGGGTSALMLNAIKDIPNAKLYSIDKLINDRIYKEKKIGYLVYEKFPELLENWTLYTGGIPSKFIEKIGGDIDFAYIDTVHYSPGEMINLLEILPFLKEEAVIAFHDVFLMFLGNFKNTPNINFSNNQVLCYIKGELILPSYGNKIFSRNIGAVKLEKNQEKYYKHYFIALGNQWKYFPEEKELNILREHLKKYYGDKLVEIYDDAVDKNRLRLK